MTKKIFKATWPFILIRAVCVSVLCLLYILCAAEIQYLWIRFFGESKFNYITSGALSLFVCGALLNVVGRLVFLFVNGWHIAAVPYMNRILSGEVSAVNVGLYSYKAHFTSFGVIFLLGRVVDSVAEKAGNVIKDLMGRVPVGRTIAKLSSWPIFESATKDIFRSCYDCVIYYLIKYTEPGIEDDMGGIVKAMKTYVFCVPKIFATALGAYLGSKVVPKFVALCVIVVLFVNLGFMNGIFGLVLAYPVWYFLNAVLFEPVFTLSVLGIFIRECKVHRERGGSGSTEGDYGIEDPKVNRLLKIVGEALGLAGIANSLAVGAGDAGEDNGGDDGGECGEDGGGDSEEEDDEEYEEGNEGDSEGDNEEDSGGDNEEDSLRRDGDIESGLEYIDDDEDCDSVYEDYEEDGRSGRSKNDERDERDERREMDERNEGDKDIENSGNSDVESKHAYKLPSNRIGSMSSLASIASRGKRNSSIGGSSGGSSSGSSGDSISGVNDDAKREWGSVLSSADGMESVYSALSGLKSLQGTNGVDNDVDRSSYYDGVDNDVADNDVARESEGDSSEDLSDSVLAGDDDFDL